MENFLDRLTQKLTVQEPAKNITAQQARDNARLQEKVKEYQECLVQLKKAQEVASALAEKGMTVEEIAKIVGMEEKVVQKWLLL